jgi:aminoglycoside N3'-acetyltransferase
MGPEAVERTTPDLAEGLVRLGIEVGDTLMVHTLDDSHGIADWSGEDYFPEVLATYLVTGRVRRGRVGHAASELFDAVEYVGFAVDWMAHHLRPT